MTECIICKEDIFKNVPKTSKGTYIVGKLKKFHKEILDNNIKVKPKMCYNCAENKIGHKIMRSLSNKERSIIYDIPLEQTKGMTKNGYSLKKAIELHGVETGTRMFEEYKEKQAYTNTLKYKQEKYGMTEEEFKDYNNSRAVTLKNQTKKYGVKEGTERFEKYKNKQKETGCSLNYFQDKYGQDDGKTFYGELNNRKANTLNNFILRHGNELGIEKFEKYIQTEKGFYSKESIRFFEEELSNIIIKYKVYYKDKEFGLMDIENNTYYKYDLVIPELKLCVEYNGDLFHANPKMFESKDRPNPFNRELTSEDIWLKDKNKLDLIKSKGYKVLVIWASDKNKEQKIKEFIKE